MAFQLRAIAVLEIMTQYDVTAPYAQIEINAIEKLSLDFGARYDIGNVTGSFAGNGQTAAIDMNGNGNIDPNEQKSSYSKTTLHLLIMTIIFSDILWVLIIL